MQWAATLAAHCLLYYVTDACNLCRKGNLKKIQHCQKELWQSRKHYPQLP